MLFGALFFALAAQVGCTKEALDHYKNEGIVEIDLTQADGSPREGNFRVHFYPVAPAAEVAAEDGTAQGGVVPEGSDPVYQHFDFEGSSFRGKLPVGSYKVLIHNTDTENLALQDEENYDKATFYVTSSAGRSGECLAQPKNLFVANCAYMESEEGEKEQLATLDVAYRGHIKVKSEPKPYVKTVVLRFSVEGDELVELTGGTFIGVSPAHHCASATCAMSSESVEFDTERIFEPDSDYTYKAEITALDLITPSSAFGTAFQRRGRRVGGADRRYVHRRFACAPLRFGDLRHVVRKRRVRYRAYLRARQRLYLQGGDHRARPHHAEQRVRYAYGRSEYRAQDGYSL